MRSTRAVVDPKALRHNVLSLKQKAPQSSVMAIIKANGYGHGALRVAGILADHVQAMGVACVEEAVELRQAGILTPIVLLEGCFEKDEWREVERHRLQSVVHTIEQLESLENLSAVQHPIQIWLKLDSGMHRLGWLPSDYAMAYERLMCLPQVAKPIGLMTHFANADVIDDPMTRRQLQQFLTLTASMHGPRSAANSAAILSYPATHFDMIRPGVMLYGVSPFTNDSGCDHGLQSVMTLESSVIAVKPIKAGEPVGYGCHWKSPRDTHIGVVAIGYGDGYPRHADNGTPVWVNDRIVPMVGAVSMDMITVDLGPDCCARVGDRVVLWGEHLPVEIVARHAHTIPYELLCGVTRRVPFYEESGR